MKKLIYVLALLCLWKVPKLKSPSLKVIPVEAKPETDLSIFLNRMAKTESGNKQFAVNRFGMLGKYQFSPRTLSLMGIHVSQTEFLKNNKLQDSVMVLYMKENARSLRKVITQFSGKTVNGVKITKSGILASAHLSGWGGVMSFFYPEKYQYAVMDANGTSVSMYMKKFANLNLNTI
jgi:hypothetical protein